MQRARKRSPYICFPYVAASLLLAAPAQASEYGLGAYLLGYSLPMAGFTPPPGLYFSNTFYLYSGSASANLNFPIGRITAAGLTENFIVNVTTVAWFTDAKILGGTLGFAAVVPFGSDTNTARVSFIGPLGFGRQINPRDTETAIGDTAYSASLSWHEGEHHWNAALTGFAPTGEYSPDRLAIMGLNRSAIDIKGPIPSLAWRQAPNYPPPPA